MTLLIASTVPAYKCDGSYELTWLTNAEAWREQGHDVFCALEGMGRDDELLPLRRRLKELGATVWKFAIDDGGNTITNDTRMVRIGTGRNLAHELFNRYPGRWEGILFIDSDVLAPADAPALVLEVDRQLVGLSVRPYDTFLRGRRVTYVETTPDVYVLRGTQDVDPCRTRRPFPEGAVIEEHWNTAGCLLLRAEAARTLRWRWDLAGGLSDDPCLQYDAVRAGFGMTWVRHDVIVRHVPDVIYPVERRGHDLRILR